jgi:protein-disulfide isomerase
VNPRSKPGRVPVRFTFLGGKVVAENSGRGNLIGAIIVGVAVIVGSVLVANALNRVTEQVDRTAGGLEELKKSVAAAQTALQNVAKAPAAAPPARRRGPDPNKVYTINTKGNHAKGPQTAKVKIVEFSDFQ